ncbi:PREDICTED: uncharacterized protein LOC104587728 [Nelumbo nucifera]|uniref:Uncharacterized protein LOC104587728 n=2 Tax=Nelumbo nucifera TaxID=4432 RepID=A0A1U7Z7Z7_NELNU|nr:PREDICTED: uncharacterized protein LOC104587728 [Nelumbo nucifera]DAD47070.1 TPA_asm: hypothetical protein HUJ06_017007 [Nelumbo nucifera]
MQEAAPPPRNYQNFEPWLDMSDYGGYKICIVHLPDFKSEMLKFQLDRSNNLKISGERCIEDDIWSRFQVEFQLPKGFSTDEVLYRKDNGVLYVLFFTPQVQLKSTTQEEKSREPTNEPQLNKGQSNKDHPDYTSDKRPLGDGKTTETDSSNNVAQNTIEKDKEQDYESGDNGKLANRMDGQQDKKDEGDQKPADDGIIGNEGKKEQQINESKSDDEHQKEIVPTSSPGNQMNGKGKISEPTTANEVAQEATEGETKGTTSDDETGKIIVSRNGDDGDKGNVSMNDGAVVKTRLVENIVIANGGSEPGYKTDWNNRYSHLSISMAAAVLVMISFAFYTTYRLRTSRKSQ